MLHAVREKTLTLHNINSRSVGFQIVAFVIRRYLMCGISDEYLIPTDQACLSFSSLCTPSTDVNSGIIFSAALTSTRHVFSNSCLRYIFWTEVSLFCHDIITKGIYHRHGVICEFGEVSLNTSNHNAVDI